jgi:hypothetical protein
MSKMQNIFFTTKMYHIGLDRELNPGPLAPEARIIPLDHRAVLQRQDYVL